MLHAARADCLDCGQPLAIEIMQLYKSECEEIADLLNKWYS